MRLEMTVIICSFAFGFALCGQSKYTTKWDYYNQLENRRNVIISALAGQHWKQGDDARRRVYLAIAKVHSGIDREIGIKYLWDAVRDRSFVWGSFFVYAMMDTYLRFDQELPADLKAAIKKRLRESFIEDKGFTENHKLQYRTARYLFGQTWPNDPALPDGLSPLEGKQEAEDWINDWIERTVTVGMYEYDSPNYHSLYFLCFTTLYDFTTTPLIQRKAWMVMQLLMADWAPEYLNGNWVGAHSREKFNQVTHTILNSGTATPFGYLYFGNSQFHPEIPEPFYAALLAVQNFQPLAILGDIATDRSKAYVHLETKAPRRGIGICTRDIPVWKYTYVTRAYALGSSYGDLSAIENHRWDLTWVSDKDGSTCFFINPSYSAEQLLRYFDSTPENIVPAILSQRPYYKDPNKWIEGSPFEEVHQFENTIIALYGIPKDERNGHVNGLFSKIITTRVTDPSGWIFCDTDSIYFAVKTLTEGNWHENQDHFRLTLDSRKTGIVMEVAQKSEYATFQDFMDQIKNNALNFDLKKLSAKYTNSRGDQLEFRFPDFRKVNDEEINLKDWPLFKGPFVNSELGSKVVTLSYGQDSVILDFGDFSIRHVAME